MAEGKNRDENGLVYLKRLEIQGFKSFADTTVLEFGPGMAAVVGPNGSGKSNLADAIRWVLGEQSARHLRGTRMEDVIFAGSSSRRPVGLAEVSLTLDNSSGRLSVPYSEVTLTRRVDRSGASDYMLNGSPCRLKDIIDLLADTGLGREAYTVVGQGRIDQVLSAKDDERRVLIEEAAGIVRYKTRKAEAARRLQRVQRRMERFRDILHDLEDRLGPLREEAARARRARQLKEELEQLEVMLGWAEISRLDRRWRRERNRVAEARDELAEIRRDLAEREQAVAALRNRLDDLDPRREELQNELADTASALERTQGRVQVNEGAVRHLTDEARRLEEELERLGGRLDALGRRDEDDAHEHRRLKEQLEAAEGELAAAAAKADAAREKEAEARRRSRSDSRELMELMDKNSRFQRDRERIQMGREDFRRREEELSRREARLAEAARELEEEEQQARDELEQAASRREAAAGAYEDLAARVRTLKEAGEGASTRALRLREELGAARTRARSMAAMQEHYEGYNRGVRFVMAGKRSGAPAFAGVIGVVADLIEVPEKFEGAIEAALGGALQNIVTETGAAAQRAIEELKARRQGRATFLPLDGLRRSRPPMPADALRRYEGIYGWASELLTFDRKYEGAVNHLLARTLVAADLTSARRTARELSFRYRIVTLDGDLVHAGGAISGGSRSRRPTELLARSRQVEELESRCIRLEGELDKAAGEARTAREELAEAEEELARLGEQVNEARWAAARAEDKLSDVSRRLRRSRQERREAEAALTACRQELVRLEERHAALRSEGEGMSRGLEALRRQVDENEEMLAVLEQSRRRAGEEREQARLALERVKRELAAMADLQRRSETEREELVGQIAARRERLARVHEEVEETREKITAARDEIEVLARQREVQRDRLAELRRERDECARRIRDMEHALAPGREAREAARDELHRRELALSEVTSERNQAARALARDYGVYVPSLPPLPWEEPAPAAADNSVQAAASGEGALPAAASAEGGPSGATSAEDAPSAAVSARGAASAAGAAGWGSPDDPGGTNGAMRLPGGEGGAPAGGSGARGDAEMPPPPTEAEIRRARRRAGEVRQELDELGDVNPGAERQLAELSAREEYLRGQYDDLHGAAGGLKTAMDYLDDGMEGLFMSAYERLRERFNAVFTRLFGGGRADLKLVPPPPPPGSRGAETAYGDGPGEGDSEGELSGDELSEDEPPEQPSKLLWGVEVLAQPPGKGLRPLALLSGGERAMTAIALLFALLEVRPAPFCIVDEIDAPLDEVNQGRFVEYLAELSNQIQFIVITHQKRTMAAADLLYGVTMTDPGVSRLVAVRMSEVAGPVR